MALSVVSQPSSGGIQGGISPNLQGGYAPFQASSINIQGSSPNLQNTVAPAYNQTLVSGSNPTPVHNTAAPPTPNTPAGPSAAQIAAQQAAAARAAQLATDQKMQQDNMNTILAQFGTVPLRSQAADIASRAAQYRGQYAAQQQSINQGVQNAELNRQIGIRDLSNTIRAGLNSGAISLGNANALDSSAALEMARAYGQYSDQQQNDINANAGAAITQGGQQEAQLKAQNQANLGVLATEKQTALQNAQTGLAFYLKQLDDQGQSQGLQPLHFNSAINNMLSSSQSELQAPINNLNTSVATDPTLQQMTPQAAAQIALQDYAKNALPTNLSGYTFNNTPLAQTPNAPKAAPTVQLPLYTNKYATG